MQGDRLVDIFPAHLCSLALLPRSAEPTEKEGGTSRKHDATVEISFDKLEEWCEWWESEFPTTEPSPCVAIYKYQRHLSKQYGIAQSRFLWKSDVSCILHDDKNTAEFLIAWTKNRLKAELCQDWKDLMKQRNLPQRCCEPARPWREEAWLTLGQVVGLESKRWHDRHRPFVEKVFYQEMEWSLPIVLRQLILAFAAF